MITGAVPTMAVWLKKVALLLGSVVLTACAGVGTRLGAASPIESLGKPVMIPTSLGRLAVWDTGKSGEGPPIVLWPSIFTDHMIYSSLLAEWRGKRRLILIDGPGHGASEGPRDAGFSMQSCADAMREVLDALSVSSAVVGGTSWGGVVAGEFAVLYPQRTQGVVMMNTPFFVTSGGPSLSERMITWGAGTLSGTRLFTDGVARAFFQPTTRSAGGPVIEHFHSSLHQADPKALATAVRSVLIERTALVDRLPLIQAPALVVAGVHDDMYPLPTQHQAAARLQRGQIVEIDSQHISIVDKPADVARQLDVFLDGLAARLP